MNKKIIIITLVFGLISFCGTFAFAWITKKPAEGQQQAITPAEAAAQQQTPTDPLNLKTPAVSENPESEESMRKTMTENQLKALTYEIRSKIQDYDQKLANLTVQEQRLQSAQDEINRDTEKLNQLRIEAASAVTKLRNEQDALQKSMVIIAAVEKDNLTALAAAYDKMDADNAGAILTSMAQSKSISSSDDAVKILYYMNERTKAKVLAAMAEKEPSTSAYFCQKLKKITEKQ